MAQLYKHFSGGVGDLSEQSAQEMFLYESRGIGGLKTTIFSAKLNGYVYGKWLLDITVAMWKEDIKTGLLTIKELYEDKNLPNWWLDSVFK